MSEYVKVKVISTHSKTISEFEDSYHKFVNSPNIRIKEVNEYVAPSSYDIVLMVYYYDVV